jgi:Malectin domain/Malectin-like domain
VRLCSGLDKVVGILIFYIKMIPARYLLLYLVTFALFVETQGQVFSPIRINVGGPSFTESSSGRKWQDDTAFVVDGKGKAVNSCSGAISISNLTTAAAPRDVYCSYRLFRKNIDVGPYTFRIPVFNTTVANFYEVRFHFAELVRSLDSPMEHKLLSKWHSDMNVLLIHSFVFFSFLNYFQVYSTPNSRVMDVWVEGVLVRKSLDVFATVGKNAAYVYTVPYSFAVNDGALNINFAPSRQNPFISGIEILPSPPPPPLYRISCGSSTAVTDSNNIVWSADQFFVKSGKPYNTCGSVANDVYCTSRYFRTVNGSPFRYEIPVPESNTVYMIRLHFSEQVCVFVAFYSSISVV